MRIAWLEPPNFGRQGDHVYRTRQPCTALGALPGVSVRSGTWLSRAMRRHWLEADVLVLQLVAEPDLWPVLDARARAGRPTVYEINDCFLSLTPDHPGHAHFGRPEVRAGVLQMARACDALQLSTPELERRYGALLRRRAVLPNRLESLPPRAVRTPGPLRVGWAGSAGHRGDLARVLPRLARLLSRRSDFELWLMGSEDALADSASLPAERVRRAPAGSAADYRAFVGRLDVGLCLLEPTAFNCARSDLKWLEYAAHGVVPICPDLAPYRDVARDGETALVYSDEDGLERAIERLLDEPELRQQIARRARDAARARCDEGPGARERLALYRSCPGAPPTSAQAPGGYVAHAADRVEEQLYDGLVALGRGAAAEARTHFERACAEAPEFGSAWLYLAHAAADVEARARALERARDVDRDGPSAPWALGALHAAQGRRDDARHCFEEAARRAPRWPWPRVSLAEQSDDEGEARGHLDAALGLDPGSVTAWCRLADLDARAGRERDARRARLRARALQASA